MTKKRELQFRVGVRLVVKQIGARSVRRKVRNVLMNVNAPAVIIGDWTTVFHYCKTSVGTFLNGCVITSAIIKKSLVIEYFMSNF